MPDPVREHLGHLASAEIGPPGFVTIYEDPLTLIRLRPEEALRLAIFIDAHKEELRHAAI
jgi:hypothetical protein